MLDIIKNDCSNILKNVDISKLKNKKILITGASGLIGVYIVSSLKAAAMDNEIHCWVNNDIEPAFLELYSNCTIIKGDITSEHLFLSLSSEKKYDIIIHCAGYGQPGKFLIDKIKTIKINTSSTIKLFELLDENGSFAFFSTSEIYSGKECENITENDIGNSTPQHSRASYIEAKRCGETICDTFSQLHPDKNIKILRLSLAYGPGTKKDDQRVLNSLIYKGLSNDTINLLDDGSSLRTYGYISDIIEMFWNILLFGKHKVYNLSGISKTSILQLAEIIGKELNKKIVISDNIHNIVGSPKNVNLSLDRYFSEFDKKSFIDLQQGIKNTIKWQRKLYEK
jgi:nucleoside-diphosphate-sugar epimerase